MANEAVRVTCPQCAGTLKVVVYAPGERQTCPKCGAKFYPPAPTADAKPRNQENWDDLFDSPPAPSAPLSTPPTSPKPASAPRANSPAPRPASDLPHAPSAAVQPPSTASLRAASAPLNPAAAVPASPATPAGSEELPPLPFDDDLDAPSAGAPSAGASFDADAPRAHSRPTMNDGDAAFSSDASSLESPQKPFDDDDLQLAAPNTPPPSSLAAEFLAPSPAPADPAEVAQLAGRFTFGVACPVCNTRIECLNTDVGQTARCPDCHSNFPIRAPSEKQARTPVGAKRAGTNATEEFTPVPPPSADPRALDNEAQRKAANAWLDRAKAEQDAIDAAEDEVYDDAKKTELFSFFVQPMTLARLAGISGLAVLAMYFAREAAPLFTTDSKNFVLLVFLVLAAPATAAWLIAGGAHAVAIFQSTTLRHKLITWPELSLLDWLGPGAYAVLAAVYAGLPGAVVGKLLFSGEGSWPYLTLCVVASWYLLYPLTFVSMAHEASLFALFSPAVYRSLSEVRRPWILFYQASGLLSLIGWGVLAFVFTSGSFVVLFCAVMTTLLGTLYFRLLGWTVAQLGEVLQPDEEEGDGKDSDHRATPAEAQPHGAQLPNTSPGSPPTFPSANAPPPFVPPNQPRP